MIVVLVESELTLSIYDKKSLVRLLKLVNAQGIECVIEWKGLQWSF